MVKSSKKTKVSLWEINGYHLSMKMWAMFVRCGWLQPNPQFYELWDGDRQAEKSMDHHGIDPPEIKRGNGKSPSYG